MKLIVGLGNPGNKYEFTRHNIGFIILDKFAELFKIKFVKGKGDWLESSLRLNDEEIFIMKPVTFMNNSGEAIKDFVDEYNSDSEMRLSLKDVLVILDDFQIQLGSIRVRRGGSDGGHNGLTSIAYELNSTEFPRMRIGIGKESSIRKEEFIDFVLGNFSEKEFETIKEMIPKYNECILSFINDGITKTMNNYNKSFLKTETAESIKLKEPVKENQIIIKKEN